MDETETRTNAPSEPLPDLASWRAALAADGRRTFTRGRWPEALLLIGWVHLACFLACQMVFRPGHRESNPIPPLIWMLELVVVLGILFGLVGRRWYQESPAAVFVTRMWTTFMILSFNLATLNVMTGWEIDWFKPVWATLSTFLFASFAWLFHPRYIILAGQMYLTGLLMVQFPSWIYAIYAVSWWGALQVIGIGLLRRRWGQL